VTRGYYRALLAAALLLAGCKLPLKPMQMNNKFAKTNQDLVQATSGFYKAIEPAFNPAKGSFNAGTARSALRDIEDKVSKASKYYEEASGPSNGSSYLGAYREFITAEQKIVSECLKPMLQVAEDAKKSPAEKWKEISALMDKATDLEQPKFKALIDAQKSFCEVNKLEVK